MYPSESKAEEIQDYFLGDISNGIIEKLNLLKN